jgi:hypothetical protein
MLLVALLLMQVLRCMQLERNARRLDGLVGTRQYNRMHARYSLESA